MCTAVRVYIRVYVIERRAKLRFVHFFLSKHYSLGFSHSWARIVIVHILRIGACVFALVCMYRWCGTNILWPLSRIPFSCQNHIHAYAHIKCIDIPIQRYADILIYYTHIMYVSVVVVVWVVPPPRACGGGYISELQRILVAYVTFCVCSHATFSRCLWIHISFFLLACLPAFSAHSLYHSLSDDKRV